jgi:hypothetical protein
MLQIGIRVVKEKLRVFGYRYWPVGGRGCYSGEVELHLGLKGFFTSVFMNLEDRDKFFEGGAYFHASKGLYMQPWKEKLSSEKETFKNVPV